MAYDEELDARVEEILGPWGATRRKMFGGTCYTLNGKMTAGVLGDSVILRLSPEDGVAALQQPDVRPFDIGQNPMSGWVMVGPDGLTTPAWRIGWSRRAISSPHFRRSSQRFDTGHGARHPARTFSFVTSSPASGRRRSSFVIPSPASRGGAQDRRSPIPAGRAGGGVPDGGVHHLAPTSHLERRTRPHDGHIVVRFGRSGTRIECDRRSADRVQRVRGHDRRGKPHHPGGSDRRFQPFGVAAERRRCPVHPGGTVLSRTLQDPLALPSLTARMRDSFSRFWKGKARATISTTA